MKKAWRNSKQPSRIWAGKDIGTESSICYSLASLTASTALFFRLVASWPKLANLSVRRSISPFVEVVLTRMLAPCSIPAPFRPLDEPREFDFDVSNDEGPPSPLLPPREARER